MLNVVKCFVSVFIQVNARSDRDKVSALSFSNSSVLQLTFNNFSAFKIIVIATNQQIISYVYYIFSWEYEDYCSCVSDF